MRLKPEGKKKPAKKNPGYLENSVYNLYLGRLIICAKGRNSRLSPVNYAVRGFWY